MSDAPWPPWPGEPVVHGSVVLREFDDRDVGLAVELGQDPYIPLIGSLPASPTTDQALQWVRAQRGRHAEGAGFSFAVCSAASGASSVAVGTVGLWLRNLARGRASVGYSVSPAFRGRGFATDAVRAVTTLAWTIPHLHRIELFIEPWNTGSLGVATAAGYSCEGLLRSYQEIGGSRRDMLLYAVTRPV